MHVEEAQLVELIGEGGRRFEVPVYQRVYAWTNRQCEELLADALQAGRAGRRHFVGTMLYEVDEDDRTAFLVDGQQRMATATLMLAALRDGAQAAGVALDGLEAHRLAERYLLDRNGQGPRLALSPVDQPTLEALVMGLPLPEGDERSRFLADNYQLFRQRLQDPEALRDAWRGIQGLTIMAARLEEGDQPQAVFESLNSRGMALSPADLIRNLLFVRFGYDEQKRLYQAYWEPIEELFPDDADIDDLYLTAALHGWLEENAPRITVQDKSEVYSAFKAFVRSNPDQSLEELLRSLNAFCTAFAADLGSKEAQRHVDWVRGKREGLVSERRLFGD